MQDLVVSLRRSCAVILVIAAASGYARAQQTATQSDSAMRDTVRELQSEITELQLAIRELRQEAAQYRAETDALRTELRSALSQAKPTESAQSSPADGAGTPPQQAEHDRLSKLQDEYDLLAGKVDDQYQTKVESASKYRVRLSGLVLLNLFSNIGAVDNLDVPNIALSPVGRVEGSFGGTLRQSQVGLEVFGPMWQGARIKANLQFDFGGGFPYTENGTSLALMRLRTGTARMDWPRTSIVAGQDAPFFSPLSPTSLASLLNPAFAYSGDLWTWTPQLRVERRFDVGEQSTFAVQAGILDPLTGQRPGAQFERIPQAGEASRQPAYATRLSWSSGTEDRNRTLGIGGYYSRQNWGLGQNVNGWAATADWSVALNKLFTVTGEFYRGHAIGGLGAGLGTSVLLTGSPANPSSRAFGLDTVGGWAQLKLRVSPMLEFNAAAGEDNPFAAQLREAAWRGTANDYGVARNRSILTNLIYRPRSDLLFSLEYRRIQSYDVTYASRSADHINLMMGVLF